MIVWNQVVVDRDLACKAVFGSDALSAHHLADLPSNRVGVLEDHRDNRAEMQTPPCFQRNDRTSEFVTRRVVRAQFGDVRERDLPASPPFRQPRLECGPRFGETPLKASVVPDGEMKDLAPLVILQVTVNAMVHFLAQRSADIVSMGDASLLQQVRVHIAHAVGVGHGSAGRGQLECHVVPEVDGIVARQKMFKTLPCAQVERVVESGSDVCLAGVHARSVLL